MPNPETGLSAGCILWRSRLQGTRWVQIAVLCRRVDVVVSGLECHAVLRRVLVCEALTADG